MNDSGLVEAVRELGLIAPGEGAECVPLSGGVSSDVFLIHPTGCRDLVVKRSIPRLRVREDWRAPVGRDAQEVAWLRAVRAVDPRLVPDVLAWSRKEHLFVMEFRAGVVWKQEMTEGHVDPGFAGGVGVALARIHAATAGRSELAAQFSDSSNFSALRIDPFLSFTAGRNPDVAERLRILASDLLSRKSALIWGDASPKNILIGESGPVFLDAETATIGDPAFDVAFCLTHLLLKTVWLAAYAPSLLASFIALCDAYLNAFAVDEGFGQRAANLIGALLLARVDGKSPAGYLSAEQDEIVRRRAKMILKRSDLDLATLPGFWRALA
ncbi:MAG TPA: aminoglycoside phosphotransferase family protein [Caulobacteraceae bacterium]